MLQRKRKRLILVVSALALVVVAWLVFSPKPGPPVQVTHPTIPMPDGVQLAATVLLPDPPPQPRLPAVVIQTRYWRVFALRFPDQPGQVPPMPRDDVAQKLVAAGYAVVLVDVRGTGASTGKWPHPFSRREVEDAGEVVRWVARQPWSDGAVGTTGVSYEGSTALLAAATAGAALKAVLARQIEWDLLDELLAPGGVRNVSFPAAWEESVEALDHNRYPKLFPPYARFVVDGVHPVDGDNDGAKLHALAAQRDAPHVDKAMQNVRRPEDLVGPDGPPVATLGPSAWTEQLAHTQAAVGIWGSFWDSATADAVLRATAAMPIAEAVIGAWNHEGTESANPLDDANTPLVDLDEVVRFFDRHLRASAQPAKPPLRRWFVAGEGRWQQAADWPQTAPKTWTLQPDQHLTTSGTKPFTARVPWTAEATTGTQNRWMSGMLQPVRYADRSHAAGVEAWRTEPLDKPLRIFGTVAVTCAVQASAGAGALHAYLEVETPQGAVRYVTEGLLRVTSGQATVRMRAVAATVQPGARLRLAVAAGDAGTFERVPATGAAELTLTGTAEVPCRLEVPVQP